MLRLLALLQDDLIKLQSEAYTVYDDVDTFFAEWLLPVGEEQDVMHRTRPGNNAGLHHTSPRPEG